MDQCEKTCETLLAGIRPTIEDYNERKTILETMSKIIQREFNTKVYCHGSFLLKTYLADGDLDVTVATSSDGAAFIRHLASFFERYNDENKSDLMQIDVTGVVLKAAVPLVKLLINNELPFDISVNAFRGLPALCFLEEVDQKFGREHLFKRTILLTKAFVKHENEPVILNSSSGLLSAFALEVMLVFIMNRFYTEGITPIQIMAKFFEYYNSFKWETHAVTIRGPAKLTDMCVVEEKEASLLLEEEFLVDCFEKYSFGESGQFEIKSINIVDPLNRTNNIGKSVNKKVQFLEGLASANKKMSIILAGNEISPKQFPVLSSKLSVKNKEEYLSLEGDFNDMLTNMTEAKQFHLRTPLKSNRDPEKPEIYEGFKVGVRSSPRGGGTLKQKGKRGAVELEGVPKLCSTLVFKFASANLPRALKIDPSRVPRLPPACKPSIPFKVLLAVPDFLTPEEARASILVLHNCFVRGGSLAAAQQLSDMFDKEDVHTSIFGLEFDRQDDADFYKNIWPDVITLAIFALLDHAASCLHQLGDVCAALSCEALKTDPTMAFYAFTDAGDGFSDQVRASVARDIKGLLNGSKMSGGNTQCIESISDIPRTHGRLRSICKSIHSSTKVELNSLPLLHGGASKDLSGLCSSLAFALESLGEGSWQRAKLCLDNLVKDNSLPHMAESFRVNCPTVDSLKGLINAFFKSKEDYCYMRSIHEVYSLSECVRKILSWEATISFISLEGTALIKVKEVVERDKKKDKKRKALGQGTTVLMQFIKDRLQSVTRNIEAASLPEKLSNAFLCLLDLKNAGLAELLRTVKEVVASNGSTRLPLGTRDFSQEQIGVREKTLSIVRNIFERHGAIALDTPVLELRETLTGKYGEDSKLIYDLADEVDELCSLRYDLTVPFARHVAMNGITSFRRYQIAKVYRRDNPSLGRYREFYQCDFDIAGDVSIGADFEVVTILTELLDELNIGEYEIKLNHRKLLDGMLDICGVPSHKFRTVCSSIDKLDKQSFEQIKKELIDEKGLDTETVDKIGSYVNVRGHPLELLLELTKEGSQFLSDESSKQALNDLIKLCQALDSAGCIQNVVFDLSLSRGLDYYTGLIYEATIKGDTEVGSIAGGGRYNDLISMFGSKRVAAIGVCLGIERVFTILEQRQKDDTEIIRTCETQVLVSIFGEDLSLAAKLVSKCWRANLKARFLVNKRQSKHFDFAKELGIPWIVMVGEKETNKGVVTLKNKDVGFEKEVSQSSFVEELVRLINNKQS